MLFIYCGIYKAEGFPEHIDNVEISGDAKAVRGIIRLLVILLTEWAWALADGNYCLCTWTALYDDGFFLHSKEASGWLTGIQSFRAS